MFKSVVNANNSELVEYFADNIGLIKVIKSGDNPIAKTCHTYLYNL